MVLQQLELISESKSPGPDNIHPKLLRKYSKHFSKPLFILFTLSLKRGILPSSWKMANIIPIYKKDSRSNVRNYRPVSLTSIVVKLLESIIKPILLQHLFTNNLIHDRQCGFLPNRSCISSLLEVLDYWTLTIDDGVPVDVLYIDFEKAFDKVQHNLLLDKLKIIGLRGDLLNWFISYLSNRKQRVKVGSNFSAWRTVQSGIPQGSVLGPILFLIFTYDSPSNSNYSLFKLNHSTHVASFADDTKFYGESGSSGGYVSLMASLSDMVSWSELNNIPINLSKCHLLRLGKSKSMWEYYIDSKVIEEERVLKDLGVWVDTGLKFSDHITKITSSANILIGLLKRTFICITPAIFRNFYKVFIRPKLEYACSVWSPFLKKDINKLEKVQRRATKCVTCIANLPYRERMRVLGLICLENRRTRADLILTWKILNGVISIKLEHPLTLRLQNRCRGHSLLLKTPQERPNRSKIRDNFFTERIVQVWNHLPFEVVSAQSISTFKGRLDTFWSNERNLPPCSCVKQLFCIPPSAQ